MEEDGPGYRDELREERTKWVTEQIHKTGEIPDDLEGYYLMINPPPVEEEPVEEPKGKGKGKGKDDKKKEDKGKKGKKGKGEKEAKPVEKPTLDGRTELTETMEDKVGNYFDDWDERPEYDPNSELYNFEQKHDPTLAKERIIEGQVKEELRKNVDEMLLMSLAKIKMLHADSKKGKKGKKEKPLPGEKLCKGQSMDEEFMLSVLVEHKMVCMPGDVKVGDLIGDFNYLGRVIDTQQKKDQKNQWTPQNPSMAQLRAAMTEYAVLPLGSNEVKKKVLPENNVRSIMLYGPGGSGKTMMAKAVAAEMGALFINISPEKLEGKFQGKEVRGVGASVASCLMFSLYTIS